MPVESSSQEQTSRSAATTPGAHRRSVLWLHGFVASWMVLACMIVADVRAENLDWLTWLSFDSRDHLGGEYRNIGLAIHNGRGFSDPFGGETGPTAWMPPALPYLTAALFWLADDQELLVIQTVIMLQGLVVVFTGVLVLKCAQDLGRIYLGLPIFFTGITANFYYLFQMTHDIWLLQLVLNLLWLGSVRYWYGPKNWLQILLWGAFGGFAALCSPIAGATWAVLTTVRWWPTRRQMTISKRWLPGRWPPSAPLVAVALISILVVTPWTIRNRVVFGKWLPVKSNGMYELWQAQCLDDDGVFDLKTCTGHPWVSDGKQRKRYRELGEMQFISEKATIAKAAIAQDPWSFLSKVGNRWIAALLNYVPFDETEQEHPWTLAFTRFVFPLPVISLILILAFRKTPLDPGVLAAMAILGIMLCPYVLISYYSRYAAPLVGIKMLLVLYGIDTLQRRFERSPSPENKLPKELKTGEEPPQGTTVDTSSVPASATR